MWPFYVKPRPTVQRPFSANSVILPGSGICWSKTMPITTASGSLFSSASASAGIGNENDMPTSSNTTRPGSARHSEREPNCGSRQAATDHPKIARSLSVDAACQILISRRTWREPLCEPTTLS